jgi:hypothetical protein
MKKNEEDIDNLDLNPPMLYINEEERRFMLLLAPILTRSPRSLKRFVNVYRLIKVGMNDEQWNVYYKKEKPNSNHLWSFKNFEVVMFLLSIITGMPGTSRMIFQNFRIKKEKHLTLQDVLEKIGVVFNHDENQWYIFKDPVSELPITHTLNFLKENTTVSEFQKEYIDNIIIYHMQMEFLNFTKWLSNWKDVQITMADWLSMDTSQLRYWDPYVSRYSFQVDPPIIE